MPGLSLGRNNEEAATSGVENDNADNSSQQIVLARFHQSTSKNRTLAHHTSKPEMTFIIRNHLQPPQSLNPATSSADQKGYTKESSKREADDSFNGL